LKENVRGFLDFTSCHDRGAKVDRSDTWELIQKAKESTQMAVANEKYLDSGASGFIRLLEEE
jgi:hypothetical protein